MDKEGFEQVEIQERLQPVLTPRLSFSTPMLSEGTCSSQFRNTKTLQVVKACLQQMEKATTCGEGDSG